MKQNSPQIVVIGGGYAGLIAANRLAGKLPDAHITVINMVDTFVERIRLHQQAAGQTLKQHPIRPLLNKSVTFVQGKVTALQPDTNQITVQKLGEDHPCEMHYDYLVYALGSMIDRDTVPGVRQYAFTLDPQTAPALRTDLETAEKLVICGGGLTGIEAATEFAEAYPKLQVTLLTRGRLGEGLSQKGYNHLRRTFDRMKITLMEQTAVSRIEADRVVTDQGEISCDVSLWAGAFAVSPLARDAGIKTSIAGQILVDPYLRSLSHPNIFAVGDAALLTHRSPLRMACATAEPLAVHAADSLIALLNQKPLKEFRFGYVIQCISLGRHNGLIQRVDKDDRALEQIVTGRAAAVIKEIICRFAFLAIPMERYLPGSYFYLKPETEQPRLSEVEVQHGSI